MCKIKRKIFWSTNFWSIQFSRAGADLISTLKYNYFLACSVIQICSYLSNISNSSIVMAVSGDPNINIFLEKFYSLLIKWIHVHQILGAPSVSFLSNTGTIFVEHEATSSDFPFLSKNCRIFQLNVKFLVSLLVLKSGMPTMKCTVWVCRTKLQAYIHHTIAIATTILKTCGCMSSSLLCLSHQWN